MIDTFETPLAARHRQQSVSELVAEARRHFVALRRLVEVHPTRNAGATEAAIQRHRYDLNLIQQEMLGRGMREQVGDLIEEQGLAVRVTRARRRGDQEDHDHLKARLNTLRAKINASI
jgi:hypothetical protein